MTRTRYALIQAWLVAGTAVAIGYLTDNPNRLTLNIPYGLAAGFLFGWLSWPITEARARKLGKMPAPRVPEACTAERPFGPCAQQCGQTAGHDGPHKASCFTWCDPHDISTDIANLWSGPKDLWNTANGGQIIGQVVTRYCRHCPWMEEHMCAFGEDGDCDHTEGWTEK